MDRYIDSKTDIKIEIQTNRQTNRLIDIYMCMQIVDGQIDTQKDRNIYGRWISILDVNRFIDMHMKPPMMDNCIDCQDIEK